MARLLSLISPPPAYADGRSRAFIFSSRAQRGTCFCLAPFPLPSSSPFRRNLSSTGRTTRPRPLHENWPSSQYQNLEIYAISYYQAHHNASRRCVAMADPESFLDNLKNLRLVLSV